jgi:hypothetical protein
MLTNKVSLFCEGSKKIVTHFVVFPDRQKICLRMTATICRMVTMKGVSSPVDNTGQAKCSLYWHASVTPWGFRTFGAFPTSCTKVVEVKTDHDLKTNLKLPFSNRFLLPYFITLFICGIPLLFMELSIGQFTGRGVIGAIGQCCPLFKGRRI